MQTEFRLLITFLVFLSFFSCSNTASPQKIEVTESSIYPHEVIPFMDQWKILLGDGTRSKDLKSFQKENFFYTTKEANIDWVVYKAPNAGITSKTSSNTRTELHQKQYWKAAQGGKLTGTLKVMHVSTSGNPMKGSAHSVVVGQIHSADGHENEPLKIFYKKFPGHTKGSVFWHYEINPEGDNSGRWDHSIAVWGYDRHTVSTDALSYPPEPQDGIALGEEFSYSVDVQDGIMHLSFTSAGHETKHFTKSLIQSDFSTEAELPEVIKKAPARKGRHKGVEQKEAYANELLYFKQGAYNQTNPKNGAKTFGRDIKKQYANGAYVEVWFKEATLGG